MSENVQNHQMAKTYQFITKQNVTLIYVQSSRHFKSGAAKNRFKCLQRPVSLADILRLNVEPRVERGVTL